MSELYVNKYGAGIVKCCASCVHKVIDTKLRICDCGGGVVRPSDCCTDWQIQKGLENAGKGGGRVKKRAYLYTIHDQTPMHEKLPTETIKLLQPILKKYTAQFMSQFNNNFSTT